MDSCSIRLSAACAVTVEVRDATMIPGALLPVSKKFFMAG